MEHGEHIVLRDAGRVNVGDPFSGVSFDPLRASGLGAGLAVEVEVLGKRDLQDLTRDPTVLNVAPVIPTRLIRPVALEGGELEEVDAGSVEAASRREAGETWGVTVTGASSSPYTGEGVLVAVLDTGIDAGHEAFAGVELIQEDFTGEGLGDGNGHGTHCAGTIFGRVVDGYRFGVAPGVGRALIGKVLDADGRGSTSQVVRAIQWAQNHGAHVVSLSLGFDFPGLVEHLIQVRGLPPRIATAQALEGYRANVRVFDALARFGRVWAPFAQAGLLVAAAGNESDRPRYELAVAPPAVADGFVSVGALGTGGEPHDALTVAPFSNTGVNVCGPGVDVYSARAGGGYVSLNGTSMATPHVAGIAALWAEEQLVQRGGVNLVELTGRLIGRARKDRLATPFDPMDVGAGLAHAPAAP